MTTDDSTGSRATLCRLMREGVLRIEAGPFLNEMPPPLPPTDGTWRRVEGMLLGIAIGDGLGNTTEGQIPARRREGRGEIRDYLPNRHAGDRPVGTPSDDTQMAFWTIEQLLEDDGLVPERLLERFSRQPIFGIGGTVQEAVFRFRHGVPWEKAGATAGAAGNGALMRIAPVLLPHLRNLSPELWADTILAAMITHNDPASTGCCVAFVRLLWDLLGRETAPEPEWWIDSFCGSLRRIEGDGTRYTPRKESDRYKGPLWRFTRERVGDALARNLSTLEACNSWYSGAYLLETVPSVMYILCRHGGDPEEAIVRAVNDTKDNDTVAAIVGAAVGALHGRDTLPKRWIGGLTGRTAEADDGRIFELIAQAKRRWRPSGDSPDG